MILAGESVRGSVCRSGFEARPPRFLENYPEMIVADGLDGAVHGVALYLGTEICVYDYWKCVRIFMERDGMEENVAVEHMDFNVVGAYLDGGPVFVETAEHLGA